MNTDDLTPDQFLALISAHKWVALAALVIHLVVRLLKSDTKIPIDIPPRWRAPLALALGAAAGALDKLTAVAEPSWTSALVQGIVAAAIAMVGHTLVIDSARAGKELPIPGLIKVGAVPGPGKPPTLPPPAGPNGGPTIPPAPSVPRVMDRAIFLLVAALMLFTPSCKLFSAANAPTTILTLEEIACIAEHAFVDQATLNLVCNLLTPEEQAAAQKVAEGTRKGVRSGAAKSAVCSSDAGAPADGGK